MIRQKIIASIFSLTLIVALTGCSMVNASSPQPKITPTTSITITSTPTQTPLPTSTPTPTEVPFYLDATVWSGNLQVPILLYHEFKPDSVAESTVTKTRLADFKAQMQLLYDNGFSLVPLQDWLDGDFVVPIGRKPLVLTLDDGLSADQLYINADGNPNIGSGLGTLWQFSQEHPDFGFSAAVFNIMGDKYYGDIQVGDRFLWSGGDAWKNKLGSTFAWGIEHGISFYNHTYTHVLLNLTTNSDIVYQLKQNDLVFRSFLERVNRSDLIPGLGNMLALPFGVWPATQSGIEILQNYKNPEGLQMQAIFEAYNLGEGIFTPSVFSADFNKYNLPRLTAGVGMIQFVIDNKDTIPTSQSCPLGPMLESQQTDTSVIATMIQAAITANTCPVGVYNVNGNVFVASTEKVELFKATFSPEVRSSSTPTATSIPSSPSPNASTVRPTP